MKAVKFLMPYTVGTLFSKGEVAGFDDAVADDLIEREIAELVKAPKGDAAAKKAAEEEAAAKKAAAEAAKAANADAGKS